jgi:hypothetical protein
VLELLHHSRLIWPTHFPGLLVRGETVCLKVPVRDRLTCERLRWGNCVGRMLLNMGPWHDEDNIATAAAVPSAKTGRRNQSSNLWKNEDKATCDALTGIYRFLQLGNSDPGITCDGPGASAWAESISAAIAPPQCSPARFSMVPCVAPWIFAKRDKTVEVLRIRMEGFGCARKGMLAKESVHSNRLHTRCSSTAARVDGPHPLPDRPRFGRIHPSGQPSFRWVMPFSFRRFW